MPKLPNQTDAGTLLEDKAALTRLLQSPEVKQVARLLQHRDSAQLQAAAQAALNGDSTALQSVFQSLRRDPKAAQAMERLEKDWT